MRSLISIHDVMPETLDRVATLVELLGAHGHCAVTLLVVPGRAWRPEQVERLAHWQRRGMELAAHGWHHEVQRIRGPYHRLHAAVISRNVAEHLALDEEGIVRLMCKAAAWFRHQQLAAPTTYVPPAWALGAIRRRRLRELPYERIEVTRGFLDTSSGRLHPLPLAGFEADTPARAAFLRAWNGLQARRARATGRPLRVSIHPRDGELYLAVDLKGYLGSVEPSERSDACGAP